jgi:hypothetical protein
VLVHGQIRERLGQFVIGLGALNFSMRSNRFQICERGGGGHLFLSQVFLKERRFFNASV